jgi:hypothetical protein
LVESSVALGGDNVTTLSENDNDANLSARDVGSITQAQQVESSESKPPLSKDLRPSKESKSLQTGEKSRENQTHLPKDTTVASVEDESALIPSKEQTCNVQYGAKYPLINGQPQFSSNTVLKHSMHSLFGKD